tara:strand:- start:429 stop:752 length:324 start_codon:yes stop_codon:yes gene_type:complete
MSGVFPLQNQSNMTVGTTNQPNQMFVPAGPVPVSNLVEAIQQRQDEEDESIQVSPIITRRRTTRPQPRPQPPPPTPFDPLREIQLDVRDEAIQVSPIMRRRRGLQDG